MRKILVVIALLALVACGSKKDKDKPAGGGSGGSGTGVATKPVDKPVTCPPGNVVKDGACVVVVTPEKIAAVQAQQTRIEDLAKLLDKVDTVGAPIELMNGIRQLEQWQGVIAKSAKLKAIDSTVGTLDDSVKKLRAFKGGLNEAAARIGNLKGELDTLLKDTGATKRIEEVRTQISSQIRATIEPLATQTSETIQNALNPLVAKIDEAITLVELGCAAGKLSGGGAKMQDMCKQAKSLFGEATKYLADFKARPAALFTEVTTKLESELSSLVDDQAKKLLASAQTQVNEALKLPPAGAGSGSAGAGSGSAGKTP